MTNNDKSQKKLSLNHFAINSVKDASKLFGGAGEDGGDTIGPQGTKPRGVIK